MFLFCRSIEYLFSRNQALVNFRLFFVFCSIILIGCQEQVTNNDLVDIAEIEGMLNIEVIDESVTPSVTLFVDSFNVSYEDNFIDLREKAISLPINKNGVEYIEFTSETPFDTNNIVFWSFYQTDAINPDIKWPQIEPLRSEGAMTPQHLSSIALFNISLNDSASTFSIPLTLIINGEAMFTDSLFTLENIHLTKAVASRIPFFKQGQTGHVDFQPKGKNYVHDYDYCYNIRPDLRDPRNIHFVVLFDYHSFAPCGVTMHGMQKEYGFYAFFTSIPEENN